MFMINPLFINRLLCP